MDAEVPYQALYRRFRPQRFADVLGQEHVTRALRSAVRDGKVVHAYLFSGPRGTGKTSTARILAMALNCEQPQDGEPCGVCGSCVAVRTGVSLDVQELDSATNRGIDEMRDLLSRVALGTPGRWKVYIVDEVHQITPAAASALLKTLEEPPGHVIFVLATTDPQKVMETIKSRTQHFEFRLLGTEVLASLLADVARRADLDIAPEALDVVVRRGHGSARDALSALDQVAAAGSFDDDSGLVSELVDAIVERDAGAVLVKVAEAATSGLDARRLGGEILEHLRNGFLATRARPLVLLSAPAVVAVEAQATLIGPAALVRAMEVIGQALIDMRDSADPRTTLEVALVRVAAPEVDDSRSALLERIERLERAPAPAAPATPARPATPASATPAPPAAPAPAAVAGRAPDARPAAPPVTPPRPTAPAPSTRSVEPRPLGAAPPLPTRPAGSGPPRPVADPPRAIPDPPRVVPDPPVRTEPAPAAAPSREELTVAWGDRILPSLRPAVKVYVANGRFLPSDGDQAIYAVPDRGLLTRAEANRVEVEGAIGQHFGRPVRMRLVLDPDGSGSGSGAGPGGLGARAGGSGAGAGGRPGGGPAVRGGGPAVPAAGGRMESAVPGGPAPDDHDQHDVHDWADLEEAPAAVSSPEQRLLDAFPGAEEVPP